jgi:predicted  nucleic acid-binding Zn-ribbon protein
MNTNISVMIDLQKSWDEMLAFQDEAGRHGKSILHWKGRAEKAAADVGALREEIKKLNAHIKARELELGDSEALIKKLEERRGLIKTEKELSALEHELSRAAGEKNAFEDELINAMDRLSSLEKELEVKNSENGTVQAQAAEDIQSLAGKITHCETRARELMERFNVRLGDLQGELQSKFRKIISSKDGKAVAALDGSNCRVCNTSIPVHVAMEAAKNEKIVNCTNCGRFLYRPF